MTKGLSEIKKFIPCTIKLQGRRTAGREEWLAQRKVKEVAEGVRGRHD